MNYMDMLKGNSNTHAPIVKRASVVDSRSAQRVAEVIAAQDFRPDREILAVMRQDRYGRTR